jgi:RimJ/RimL family protein N-acetyltransferase
VITWDRERCATWARERIPGIESWSDWYQAFGWETDGKLVAAVVYTHFNGSDIWMHCAIDCKGKCLTRTAIKAAFRYPFVQLGCRRVTGLVAARNVAAQKIDEKLGFVREGLLREGLPDDDLIVFGMLKKDCRWL